MEESLFVTPFACINLQLHTSYSNCSINKQLKVALKVVLIPKITSKLITQLLLLQICLKAYTTCLLGFGTS